MSGMEFDNIRLAEWFSRFAEQASASPMYQFLSRKVSEDEESLRLASKAEASQPVPNLFFASIHYLVLQNRQTPLAAFYPSAGGTKAGNDDHFWLQFKLFCKQNEPILVKLMESRLVQTNEVQRTALLLPALREVARRTNNSTSGIAVIDVGSSGGLNLLLDKVSIEYSDGSRLGPLDSRLELRCKLTGRIDTSDIPLNIVRRIGVDLNPINFEVTDELRWAEALVWPDQLERLTRLRRGVEMLKQTSIEMRTGDAAEVLPQLLSDFAEDVSFCVMHSFVLNQFTEVARERFDKIVSRASIDRNIWRIGLEWIRTKHPELTVYRYEEGELRSSQRFAECDGHGGWLDWKPDDC